MSLQKELECGFKEVSTFLLSFKPSQTGNHGKPNETKSNVDPRCLGIKIQFSDAAPYITRKSAAFQYQKAKDSNN